VDTIGFSPKLLCFVPKKRERMKDNITAILAFFFSKEKHKKHHQHHQQHFSVDDVKYIR
jgi:hypothetical protein